MRRIVVLFVVTAMLVIGVIPAASAKGLTQDKLEGAGWACGDSAELPPGHCVNPGRGQGAEVPTFNIMVFEGGDFHSAEGATFQASADDRPCPQDAESPDGTWWNPPVPGLYVCHHR